MCWIGKFLWINKMKNELYEWAHEIQLKKKSSKNFDIKLNWIFLSAKTNRITSIAPTMSNGIAIAVAHTAHILRKPIHSLEECMWTLQNQLQTRKANESKETSTTTTTTCTKTMHKTANWAIGILHRWKVLKFVKF